MYKTSYGATYGTNGQHNERTGRVFDAQNARASYVNSALTQKQAPMTLQSQGYAAHGQGPMARTATMPTKIQNMNTTFPDPMEFAIRTYKLPQLASMPNKSMFRPVGAREHPSRQPNPYKLVNYPGYAVAEPELNMNGKMASQYRCYSANQYESAMNAGKQSISRRLEDKLESRYHITGYMGFVPGQQYRHGDSYGRTTRICCFERRP